MRMNAFSVSGQVAQPYKVAHFKKLEDSTPVRGVQSPSAINTFTSRR
jgi:hypothetical protein